MIYSIPIPARFADKQLDAGQVETFLKNRGVVVNGVTVTRETIEVDADVDPRDQLQTYEIQPNRRQQIRQLLGSADIDNATNAQLKQAVKLLVELVLLRDD